MGWQLSKLGRFVDASDVVSGSGTRLHGIDQGGLFRAFGTGLRRLEARPLDSALVSLDRLSAFPTPLYTLSSAVASGDLHFPLQNNYWDTNYPLWYPFDRYSEIDDQARFR